MYPSQREAEALKQAEPLIMPEEPRFRRGDMVNHNEFGPGTVRLVKGDSVTVRFKQNG